MKLWAFAAKGYTDIEINAPTAKKLPQNNLNNFHRFGF